MKTLKKNWSNILFGIIVLLLLVPKTRMPIQVFVNRLFSFSPAKEKVGTQKRLSTYQWSLSSLKGEKYNFASSKGKVVLVNFWATWCPPCVAEMPEFQKLYDTYKKKVDFYFITTDPKNKVIPFLQKKDLQLPVYHAISHPPKPIDGFSLPTTYLIDKKGDIVIDKTGAARWNSKKTRTLINTLLKK